MTDPLLKHPEKADRTPSLHDVLSESLFAVPSTGDPFFHGLSKPLTWSAQPRSSFRCLWGPRSAVSLKALAPVS